MNQTSPDTNPSNTALALIASWFRYSQTSGRIDPKIELESRLSPMGEQADYGDYNEAYVIHHWASFGPRY